MAEVESPREPDGSAIELLESIRSGVRQRRAELACLDEALAESPGALGEARLQTDLQEPSFDAEGGSALVLFLQKLLYHAFSRRHHRALLVQQTRFNRSASQALDDLHRRQARLHAALRDLERRLTSLEAADAEG